MRADGFVEVPGEVDGIGIGINASAAKKCS
jgi:hypothetical protein